jgi:hypothetical protein
MEVSWGIVGPQATIFGMVVGSRPTEDLDSLDRFFPLFYFLFLFFWGGGGGWVEQALLNSKVRKGIHSPSFVIHLFSIILIPLSKIYFRLCLKGINVIMQQVNCSYSIYLTREMFVVMWRSPGVVWDLIDHNWNCGGFKSYKIGLPLAVGFKSLNHLRYFSV